MTLKEETAQGKNVVLEFKETRSKDSLKYLKTGGAVVNGCGLRMVSDTSCRFE